MEVQQSKNNELVKKIRRLAITKQLNFLIGSGTSLPAVPLMGMIQGTTDDERNAKLADIVKEVSRELLQLDVSQDTPLEITLKNYINFLSSIVGILNLSNSRQAPRTANIFTTNYDLFIEKASDEVLQNYRFIFNDGASGYFDRKLDGSNYNRTVSYKGLNDNYTNEIPSLTLIKPHGSMNWENINDAILIRSEVLDRPVIVKPTGYESQETFINNHFHEMLRIFQLELDKPQSVLFVIGFSFQDKHIAKMIKRAIQNPELMIYAFAFKEEDRAVFLRNLDLKDEMSNFKIITPNNLNEVYKTKGANESGEDIFTFTIENFTRILSDQSLEDMNDENS
ncbi:SIR2 family protein [Lysinibacillus sp. CD3-6]|uniref:SIR2 family protein n=1 Tax=Lysinibacillus sp. CD3-6 TaxID=2892541 RepID=UPI00116AADF8|nr:SIR2 family protein [Lysinibacillus sp. CD3-6]UED79287.1 SIR2 family protein [Lysinibacillus sp. CD3-6]